MLKIKLGNLMPHKEVKLQIQLIQIVTVDFSSYKFTLPSDFYPNYIKMGAPNSQKYTFSFVMDIKSTKKITQISAPENSECTRDESGTKVTVICKEPSR